MWHLSRNLIFWAKLQNGLSSCTSWGYVCNTNEICDTYPESFWYKLLKKARKIWKLIYHNFGQKYPKTDTVTGWGASCEQGEFCQLFWTGQTGPVSVNECTRLQLLSVWTEIKRIKSWEHTRALITSLSGAIDAKYCQMALETVLVHKMEVLEP